ncbi:uncharacterized mitochondrial protein-like protein [Tanacetum coccineum]
MQDMLPGVLSIVLILLGPTVTNSSSLPIECRMTVNSSVLHSLSGLSMSRSIECQYAVLNSQNTPYCLEEQIRRLDCKTQYAVLGRRFDTSYLTGGYGVSGCILLVVYVDDIVIMGSDKAGIKKLKSFIDLLDDAVQIEAKPCDEPMIPKLKLRYEDGRLLHNPEKYRRVVGKLNYLTITRPDIAFPGTPGLGILYANHGHHIAEGFTDADYAGCPNTSCSTTGYCVFVGGNLVSWKSKKQNVVIPLSKPMKIWCDNQAAIYIATNLVFHERTKHIEVDCHFTREKLEDGTITTPYIRIKSQLADILTKALPRTRINSICNKLGMINIMHSLRGNVKICIRVRPSALASEIHSIRRIEVSEYGILEFLGVGTTINIFQNILELAMNMAYVFYWIWCITLQISMVSCEVQAQIRRIFLDGYVVLVVRTTDS